ncbi:MAG: protein-export chaperone SecB [Nevskia sp.]|nr:protein-export chaperone SecB [Nevskia sp.]
MSEAPPATARQILLQRIYLKDASVEVPLAPQVFTRPWTPQVEVQIGTATTQLEQNTYQVMLTVTVTAKLGDDVGFLVEVHQGGIFHIAGFSNDAELQAVLAAYCPGVVFPFAREAVAELVQRGGFPPMLLQPINFEALYVEHLERARTGAAVAEGGPSVSIVQ